MICSETVMKKYQKIKNIYNIWKNIDKVDKMMI